MYSPSMGIKLGDIVVKQDVEEEGMMGRLIAFDGYNVMYQFLSSIRDSRGYPLTSPDGRVVSHLKGIFSRNIHMIKIGIEPVFVFDGKPHDLKSGILGLRRERKIKADKEWQAALEEGDLKKARMKAQQTSRLTDDMLEDADRLLKLMGIPVVKASGEGEAQAAFMCLKGDVYAVASQDYDSLLFGTPRLIRNLALSDRRKLPGRNEWVGIRTEMIDLEKTLSILGITREQFIDLAILVGTDFNEGVKGIGPKKALEIVRNYGHLEGALEDRRIPPLEWNEVRRIFLQPDVTEDYTLSAPGMDPERVVDFLCDDMGFSKKGVEASLLSIKDKKIRGSQSLLEQYF